MKVFNSILLLFALLLSSACSSGEEPLDSKARRFIDSAATSQIRIERRLLDSLCTLEKEQNLDHLVDSIKQERLREIEELTKGYPK